MPKITCPFYNIDKSLIKVAQGSVAAIENSARHMLIIPKRHCETYFDITEGERQDAGQTIFHTHINLIQRCIGPSPAQKCGVRGGDNSGENELPI